MTSVFVDALGKPHPPAGADARIVALVPSITELLFALDLGAQVVGRTGFCVHPRDAVQAIPKVGGTKDVKIEALRALRPTHVIVNIDENEAPTVETIRAFTPHVVVTHPNAPVENLALYRLLGGIFDRSPQAEALCAELQRELDACAAVDWKNRVGVVSDLERAVDDDRRRHLYCGDARTCRLESAARRGRLRAAPRVIR